jgi:CBS domain-containing protein
MAEIYPKIERMVAVLDEHKTALDAAQLMAQKFIGSVVVTGSSHVKGIFTERDLLRRIVCEHRDPGEVKLKDVMRTELVTVQPHDSVELCLEKMKEHRTRHLLVYDGKEFIGVVSLRDMVALMLAEKEELIGELTRYITS